jgi:hypothetical protein
MGGWTLCALPCRGGVDGAEKLCDDRQRRGCSQCFQKFAAEAVHATRAWVGRGGGALVSGFKAILQPPA